MASESILEGEPGNMLAAVVSIKGTRPILWNHFRPEVLMSPSPGNNGRRIRPDGGGKGNDPNEWRQSVLTTKDRQLFVYPEYIFGCLREAAKFTRKGRGSIQSDLAAALQVIDDLILIDRYLPEALTTDVSQPVYLDIRAVVNPGTKARNVRYRVAAAAGWMTCFTLVWDSTILSKSQVEAVIIDAGRLVGVADGRALGFGRFSVESFEVGDA